MAPDGISWTAPWFGGWREPGAAAEQAWRTGATVRAALPPGQPCFVAQDDLPVGVAYEQFIFDTGQVPTRDNLHDFFNGLCWRRFPLTKHWLNRLQVTEIARDGVRATRGPVRDSLTLFDENAALLQAPEPLWQALLARDWVSLFVELRPLWAQARLVLFGHALLEKLVEPYKSITAHVYRVPVPETLSGDATWDAWLASSLMPEVLATKPFTPLPVLGVPGWWPANEEPAFYADSSVFRPPRA